MAHIMRGRTASAQGIRACEVRSDALDHLPRRWLPRSAAAFKVVRAFPNLKFEHPLLIARPPGSDRLFVGEQAGVLYSFPDKPDAKADLFFDLRKEIKTIHLLPEAKEVEAVYGLAFHPDFEKNRQCFVCYTLRRQEHGQPNLKDGTRVSRFTVTKTDPPRIDPASEEIVLTFLQGGHNGGDLHFGPDRMLYISTGDAANPNPPDPLNTGQDISDLLPPSCGSTWTTRTRARTTPSRRTTRSSA